MTTALEAQGLTLAYDGRVISTGLDLEIPHGRITAIVGPNGCGKSTALRALSRLLSPREGRVLLEGEDIRRLGGKELARRLALLPQTSQAPGGITVADLVARGRFPHQHLLQQWSADDARATSRAMAATNVSELGSRGVDELSGGQRQRVWIAMLLAQDAPVMLLDEPTTYLDIAHQLEVLELVRALNRDDGRTIVLVLHDLAQAARYADHLVVMSDGRVAATGEPAAVLTEELVADVFGLEARIVPDPVFGMPLVIPIASRAGADGG
ncbi:ABC transporter ATP-binding protein [Microbacterium sp. gxy059]|uniref:ABC transporter ATP-binding protein n=1 Tax=Microbacterium sp. gxy059 TaxID=2957199 RepID=UPI003D998623